MSNSQHGFLKKKKIPSNQFNFLQWQRNRFCGQRGSRWFPTCLISVRLLYTISHKVLITDLWKHDLYESTYCRMGTTLAGKQNSEWYQEFIVKMKEHVFQSSIKLNTASGSTQYFSYHLDNETRGQFQSTWKGMNLKRLQRMSENQTWIQNMVEKLPKKCKFSPSCMAVNKQHMHK